MSSHCPDARVSSARSLFSASDCAKESSRQTMSAADVLKALNDLEFDDFLGPVEASLNAFREEEKARVIQSAAKRAAKEKKEGGGKDKDDEGEAEGGGDKE